MANKEKYKKVSFNIPIKLLDKVKTYSEELGLSYTNGFVFLLTKQFEQQESLTRLDNFRDSLKFLESFKTLNNDSKND